MAEQKHIRKISHPLISPEYERSPVSPRQFLEDDYYFGKSLKKLSETWKKEFDDLFAPKSKYTTLVLTGAIGTGKSTFAAAVQGYVLYRLSCLRDPAEFYGLLPRSKIVFGVFNVTLTKADDIAENLRSYVDESEYFLEHCQLRKRPMDPMFFPRKRIQISVGSLANHALGDNMFSFVLEEANFHKKIKNIDQQTIEQAKTRAHEMFNAARTRLVSRFMKRGQTPGMITIVSSKKFQSDFVDEFVEKVEGDAALQETVKVIDLPLWATKDPDDFSGDYFHCLVGNDAYESRPLEEDEIAPNGVDVVAVPTEYYDEFALDADLALRDIAGVSTAGSRKFFPVMDRIHANIDHERFHPFTRGELSIGLNSEEPISSYVILRDLCHVHRSRWIPNVDPTIPRHVHVDIAYSEECLGFAMGHPHVLADGRIGVYMDMMLRIRPPTASEIDLEAVVTFIKWLRSVGFQIKTVTFDQFQSRMPIQLLMKAGMDAQLLSIDLMHYVHMKIAFNDYRVSMYQYAPLLGECKELLRDPTGKKRPSHPPKGFDDVSDAVAGVVSKCFKIDSKLKKKYDRKKDVVRPGIQLPGVPLMTTFNMFHNQAEIRKILG